MQTMDRRIVHVLDDLAMGGVTRALRNFDDKRLQHLGHHETVDIRTDPVRAHSPHDIAVVHFTSNWRKLGWLMQLRLIGGFSQLILIEHSYTAGYEVSEVRPKMRFRRMLKCAYGLVDKVVAVSKTQRDWILDNKLAPASKTIAIAQSRPCDALLQVPPVKRLDGPLKIGAFGRFHKQKGFDLLVKAMAHIPVDLATLKIAGTGPDEAELKSLAANLEHVEICEPFTSPNSFVEGLDVVAIPSRWEAFGLVGTEARAAGRPLIAARVDGLVDQLCPASFAHAPGNEASIVRAIYRAAAANNLTQQSHDVRQRAAKEYDTMIEGWAQLLSRPVTRSQLARIKSLALTL